MLKIRNGQYSTILEARPTFLQPRLIRGWVRTTAAMTVLVKRILMNQILVLVHHHPTIRSLSSEKTT